MKTRSLFVIIICIAIIVLCIQSIIQYNVRSKIQHSMQRMEQQMDRASHDLAMARLRMEALKHELNSLQNYIDSTSLRIEKLNQGKQISSRQYEGERKQIIKKLDELYLSIDSTRKSLPEIIIQE
jgi:predicted  nucleic acid-binding Zn-ribbon protein